MFPDHPGSTYRIVELHQGALRAEAEGIRRALAARRASGDGLPFPAVVRRQLGAALVAAGTRLQGTLPAPSLSGVAPAPSIGE